jgi:hypothetical protein
MLWAADFETPAGSSTFSPFSWAANFLFVYKHSFLVYHLNSSPDHEWKMTIC